MCLTSPWTRGCSSVRDPIVVDWPGKCRSRLLAFVLAIFAIAAGALTARRTILPIGQFAHASTVAGLRPSARGRRGVVLHELGNVPARAMRAR